MAPNRTTLNHMTSLSTIDIAQENGKWYLWKMIHAGIYQTECGNIILYFVSLCWLLCFIKRISHAKSLASFRALLSRAIIFSNILPTYRCGHVAVPHSAIFSWLWLVAIVCSSLSYHIELEIMGATKLADEMSDVRNVLRTNDILAICISLLPNYRVIWGR